MKSSCWIKIKYIFILCHVSLLFSTTTLANSALSDLHTIKIGMTTALSGPAQMLGNSMKQGIDIYFNKINAAGGIDGKKLQLITLDDGYEPELAGRNMRHLIDKDKVIAIIGNVGAPTAALTVPIANEKKILLFGAFSGSDVLRKIPPDRYVINFRASYKEELASMIKNLLSIGIKPDELAFFTQNDAYGDTGYRGAMEALKAAGYAHPESLPYGRYVRNTKNVEAGLAEILAKIKKPLKAIIIVGTYEPSAKFIELASKEFHNVLFLNVSFVGSTALSLALDKNSDNVIITQVVPYFNTDLIAVREYRNDIKKYLPGVSPGFISLEGYLVAKLFVFGLQKAVAENKLTREGIIDVFENMNSIDIGIGEIINFDRNHHQALHVVWPTIIKNGKFEPLDWSTLSVKNKES